MKILKRSVPMWAFILALAACGSITLAAIVVTREISISMQIQLMADMQIYNVDHTTVLTTVNFGVLYRGDTKRVPISPDNYFANNIGERDIWVSYTTVNWPADVTLKVYVKRGDGSDYSLLGKDVITSFVLKAPPGPFPNTDWMAWYMEVSVSSTASEATYSPTLTWRAHDTSSG